MSIFVRGSTTLTLKVLKILKFYRLMLEGMFITQNVTTIPTAQGSVHILNKSASLTAITLASAVVSYYSAQGCGFDFLLRRCQVGIGVVDLVPRHL